MKGKEWTRSLERESCCYIIILFILFIFYLVVVCTFGREEIVC